METIQMTTRPVSEFFRQFANELDKLVQKARDNPHGYTKEFPAPNTDLNEIRRQMEQFGREHGMSL